MPTVKGDITMNETQFCPRGPWDCMMEVKSTKELKHRQSMMPQEGGPHATQVLRVYIPLVGRRGKQSGTFEGALKVIEF